MAFYNKKRDNMTRTVFSNTFEPAFVNPFKKYYAFVEFGGKEVLLTYEGKYRTEAIQYFHEEARLNGGKYNGNLHAFKN